MSDGGTMFGDELLRRQSRRAQLQCSGSGEGGVGGGLQISRLMSLAPRAFACMRFYQDR